MTYPPPAFFRSSSRLSNRWYDSVMSPFDNPDYHALIRRIREIDRAGGDSTLARLVTADWLQDHGEEKRAEFVRLSVDLDGPSHPTAAFAETAAMSVRRDQLFAGPHPELWDQEVLWLGLDPQGNAKTYLSPSWERGWVSGVRCSLARWLAHGPDLCRRHPVREVVITDWEPVSEGEIYQVISVVMPDQVSVTRTVTRAVGTDFMRRDRPDLWRLVAPFGGQPFPAATAANAAVLQWAESEADAPVISAAPCPPA